MAIVKAPLLSLGARGRLDKSLIFQEIKGQSIAKAYAVPTFPNSPAQELWRNEFQERADFWQTFLRTSQFQEAFKLSADRQSRYLSVYLAAMRSMRTSYENEPQKIYITDIVWTALPFPAGNVKAIPNRITDHANVSSVNNYRLLVGTTPENLTAVSGWSAINAPIEVIALAGSPGDTRYMTFECFQDSTIEVMPITKVVFA